MSTPNPPKILSDEVAARASQLHDAAFFDPKIPADEKPSWADSVRQAQEEIAADEKSHN